MATYLNNVKAFITQEKAPLVLLVLAQAYVLFLWMIGKDIYTLPELTILFAIITAVSLDSVVVSTTFSKNRSRWSMVTALVAMVSGVLIVVDLFYRMEWHWIHATFPILVFFFSQHLAEEKSLANSTVNASGLDKEETISRLIELQLNNSQIYSVIGGNRNKMITLINSIRDSALQSPDTTQV